MTAHEQDAIKALREEIVGLREDHTETQSQLSEIRKMSMDTYYALKGNEISEDGGLVGRVKLIETKQEANDKHINKFLYIGSIVGGVLIIIEVASKLMELFKH